jgi:two-component system, NtrC family, response regulator AtoC
MQGEQRAKDSNRLTDLPPDSVIFGKSLFMLDLEAKMKRILVTNLPILLQGESGTGKGVLSKFIHNHSEGIIGPYVRVNCARFSGTLVEMSAEDKPDDGVLPVQPDISSIGTLFLDEVGELSSGSQLHLSHSLPERQGDGYTDQPNRVVRARIISSTARNLRQEVIEKKFRRDLFYQLAVVTLEMPPLRHRLDDLLTIANYLRQHHSANFGFPDRPFPDKLIARMYHYGWPGNIRELENFVCRYIILGSDERVLRDLNFNGEAASAPTIITPGGALLRDETKRALASVEREMIVKALELHDGSLKRAAHTLGISYRTLMNKMDQAGLPRTRHHVKSRRDRTR